MNAPGPYFVTGGSAYWLYPGEDATPGDPIQSVPVNADGTIDFEEGGDNEVMEGDVRVRVTARLHLLTKERRAHEETC